MGNYGKQFRLAVAAILAILTYIIQRHIFLNLYLLNSSIVRTPWPAFKFSVRAFEYYKLL